MPATMGAMIIPIPRVAHMHILHLVLLLGPLSLPPVALNHLHPLPCLLPFPILPHLLLLRLLLLLLHLKLLLLLVQLLHMFRHPHPLRYHPLLLLWWFRTPRPRNGHPCMLRRDFLTRKVDD